MPNTTHQGGLEFPGSPYMAFKAGSIPAWCTKGDTLPVISRRLRKLGKRKGRRYYDSHTDEAPDNQYWWDDWYDYRDGFRWGAFGDWTKSHWGGKKIKRHEAVRKAMKLGRSAANT